VGDPPVDTRETSLYDVIAGAFTFKWSSNYSTPLNE